MTVAAIMPTYNQHEFIAEAIGSVAPYVDRLIVVDDASEPPIVEANVRHEDNRGTAAAINSGFPLTAGAEWVTWVSSDNLYEPDWPARMLKHTDASTGAVFSAFWRGSRSNLVRRDYDPDRLISTENCYIGPSFLIRRSVWLAAGDHRGGLSHDYDHWTRVEEACWRGGLNIVAVPDPLCFYRVHDQRESVLRRRPYDAKHWQAEARRRRGLRPERGQG